jgi:hypothetical protein
MCVLQSEVVGARGARRRRLQPHQSIQALLPARQERGLPGACRSLERPASVPADRLSRPELDEGVATALGLRIENPRAVADLDLFDGQLGFQLDRTK